MAIENLAITKDKTQGATRFTIQGRVNSKNSPALQRKLEDALKDGDADIVLDMSRVEFLSSDGIRIILKIYKEADKAGGKLRIERPSENVRNVLGMVALNDMLI